MRAQGAHDNLRAVVELKVQRSAAAAAIQHLERVQNRCGDDVEWRLERLETAGLLPRRVEPRLQLTSAAHSGASLGLCALRPAGIWSRVKVYYYFTLYGIVFF